MPELVPKGPDVPVDLPNKSPLSNAWDPHRIRHSLPNLLRTAALLDRAEPQGPQRRVRVRRRSGLPARCERPGGHGSAGRAGGAGLAVHAFAVGLRAGGHARTYHPLVASVGATGDIVDARRRTGRSHRFEFITEVLNRAKRFPAPSGCSRLPAGDMSAGALLALYR